ncbi:hypothetical protein BDZ97DRAFT_1828495 [Flammula alnicola]|nr:hypothetical protein BDZ97DRAFT_1828495 [Flammula alnicola]
MMLVQLPAMDAVTVPALSLPSLPSFGAVVPSSLASSLSMISHTLTRPSVWLVLLASLVILSSIRAALLYIRPPPSTAQKSAVSLVQLSKSQSTVVTTSTVLGTSEKPTLVTSSTSSPTPGTTPDKLQQPSADSKTVVKKETTTWFWGLVKWDSLPSLPVVRSATAGRGRGVGGVSMSETERGRWHSQQQQQHSQQEMQQQGRRPGPAFDHPLPALYESEIPVSMAKMIMSRHTFRRPTSRPPPVRNANAPQYQRRTPSMV